jgi:energy-coupling factor transporter ATP-binding protein EcfA2/exonuclease VII small subunit
LIGLVGPNGAGKSSFLRRLALELRKSRNLAIICNTTHDRFSGIRGIKRISASRWGHSAKTVVKQAIADTLDREDSRFYQIVKILEHCGYRGRIGFKIKMKSKHKPFLSQGLLDGGGNPRDIDLANSFLERFDPRKILWVGDYNELLGYSQAREFASVLRLEVALRNHGYLSDIQVYLDRINGPEIELLSASSGELSLISSLLFLVANREKDPVILVDEPENSLHPSWQREYVDKLLNALEYRDATVIIATHSPLIVTGALASSRKSVSVFQIAEGIPKQVRLTGSAHSTESIEEILWRAFEVITPANHYVSEELVEIVNRLERGDIDVEAALARVNEMSAHSFEKQQRDFFGAVRELIAKVASEREVQRRDD